GIGPATRLTPRHLSRARALGGFGPAGRPGRARHLRLPAEPERPFRFYLPGFPPGFDPIVLAGRYVAYGDYSDCAASFCDPNSVILQNLRNGHITFADGPGIRIANVSALVLKRDGSFAWIASTFDEFGALQ